MKTANIRLGLRCNENCLFCTVANDDESNMSTKEVKETIKGLSDAGNDRLTLTGGEPTLREDLIELIRYARSKNIEVVDLQTNGVKLADEHYLLGLKEAGLNYVTFGFPSHKKETYNHLTQSDCYEKALLGIKNCVKHKIPSSVYHVINKHNYHDLMGFIDFIQSISKEIEFAFAFLRPNGNTLKNPQIVPKLTEIELFIHEMFNHLRSKDINCLLEGVPLCYMQGFEVASAETWRMAQPPVDYISEGKTKHSSLHQFINSNLKAKSSRCRVCKINPFCAGVWKEYADLHGTNELFPIFSEVDFSNG